MGTGTPVQIAEIKKWSWNPKNMVVAYRSNKTLGYTRRLAGNFDGTGSIDGVWDPTNPITAQMDVGSAVTLNLQTISGQKIVVNAVIETIKLDVDNDTGDVVSWSADFGADGTWVRALATTPLMGPLPGPGLAPAGAPEGQPEQAPQQGVRGQTPQPQSAPQGQGPDPALVQAVTQAVVQSLLDMGVLVPRDEQASRAA